MNQGDKEAFLAQYQEIHEPLMRFCTVKSRGIMDPQDLAGDVLLIGLENYHKIKDKKSLLAYLFTTANNICKNKLRRKKFSGDYHETMATQLPDYRTGAEEKADISVLYAALDQLPPLQKEAVILFEISDLPIKEIMVIQNAGASAVKQRIKRGREKLAELLKEKEHRKKAVVASVLFTSNSFAMSDLNTYFQAIKELPLPLSHQEAISTINQFQLTGAATHAAASKLGTAVVKKTLLGTALVGGTITGAILLSSPADKEQTAFHQTEEKPLIAAVSTTPSAGQFNSPNLTPQQKAETDPFMVTADFIRDTLEQKKTDSVSTFNMVDTSTVVIAPLPEQNKAIQPTTPLKQVESGEEIPVKNTQTIVLQNFSDNLIVKTWDRPFIQVNTQHEIKAKTPEDEAIIREHLSIKTQQKGNRIVVSSYCNYTTRNNSVSFGNRGSHSITFDDGKKAKYNHLKEHYEVMIPAGLNLVLNESYANVTLPDIDADLSGTFMDVDMTAGNVSGKVDLKMNYSKASIGNFKQGKLVLMETDMNMGDTDQLTLNARYSDVFAGAMNTANLVLFEGAFTAEAIKNKLEGNMRYVDVTCHSNTKKARITAFESKLNTESIDELKGNIRYTTIKATTIETLVLDAAFESHVELAHLNTLESASSKYTTYKIGQLKGSVNLQSFEDRFSVESVTDSKNNLYFDGRYSKYSIAFAQPANYQLDFQARYGSYNFGDLNLTITDQKEHNENHTIKGYFHEGNAQSPTVKFSCFESKIALN